MNIRKRIYQQLRNNGPLCTWEIAHALFDVRPSSITSLMTRMQQDGVIERVPGERKNPLTGCKQGLRGLVGDVGKGGG